MSTPEFRDLLTTFLSWHHSHPPPPIPWEVAATGAGSEARMPFTHFANVIPVYLYAALFLDRHPRTKSLLDHGTGTGRPLAFLASQFPRVKFIGIDQSLPCIRYASTHYTSRNLGFHHDHPDYQPTPHPLVISSHVLEHVPPSEVNQFLTNLHSHLTPHGTLVLGTPNRAHFQDLYCPNPTDSVVNRLVLPHEHEYTARELHSLLMSHFKSVTILGTHNPTNSRFTRLAITRLRPRSPLHSLLLYSLRRLTPQPLLDSLGRRATERILTDLHLTYPDLLTSTRFARKPSPTPQNFIALCHD